MDTALYDGKCSFCTASVKTLRRLDITGQLQFLSLHDPSVSVRFPDLTYEMLMEQMWVVSPEGNNFGGANALRYLSRRLPLLYPFAIVLYIPGSLPVWKTLYRCIAQRRYKLAGTKCDDGSCSLHAHSNAAGKV